MKKFYLLMLAIGCQLLMEAQSTLKFFNNTMVGLLAGSSSSSWQLEAVNGLSYKTYSAGLGIGVDHYYYKTIPLFVDVRKNIFDRKETPFLYLDLGTNYPGKKDEVTTWQTSSYTSGLYYDFGLGYKWTLAKQFSVNASFGYSKKKYGNELEYHYGGDVRAYPEKYEYSFQRFTMKLGFGF